MDTGFDVAKGAAERVFGVKLPILMHMILPGLLATAVFYRLVARVLSPLPWGAENYWQRVVAFALMELTAGALISTGGSQISKVYEGRAFWPEWLRARGLDRQQARVSRLRRKADEATDEAGYDDAWFELRAYPIDEKTGERVATRPTLLGNIMAQADQYSWTRYGMDAVFYWSRIWMLVDKDQKEDIDNQWSVADGFLTLSAISMAGAAVWTAQIALSWFSVGTALLPWSNRWLDLAGVAAWLLLGLFWYRLSLPFHRANGELAKAVFDLYRDKVRKLATPAPHEKAEWGAAWAFLQYLSVRCPNCGNWTDLVRETCKVCSFGMAEVKRNLALTGELPPGED